MSARTRSRRQLVAVSGVALFGATLMLTACGGDGGRDAKSVTATQHGTIVTHSQNDYGDIIIGWGEKHLPTEITTPSPDDVSARCFGNGDDLSVEITAPYGWKISVSNPSEVLSVENTEQKLEADLDTSNKYYPDLREIDWSTPDHVDIAAAPKVPDDWYSRYGANQQMYVSLHVDCT
ncbi:hypothetical protein [Rhodococcus sp. BH5]|uniref:hypothetical protein n=1 Tax=Rhodococcus sp. BH5 TaxID=2871702 RepID=UPI0022CD9F9E|nr:hypothetical protein [Rhodococcus sp. BH5]MCZ9635252.1 hypothetical protein [Rhodococcus sp. BH5]